MKFLKITGFLFVAVMIAAGYTRAEEANLAPLGFEFGISDKDAKKIIDSNGKRIIENKVDSKKIRTIEMQGTIVEVPLGLTGIDVRTSLEFFDKKLLSTSLVVYAEDSSTESLLEENLSNYFVYNHGEPSETDSMMYFKTWTWHLPKVKLVLNTNTKDNVVKVEYTYKPISQAKFEKEIDKRRGTKVKDPSKEMFLDGDYSKPTDYDEKYRAPEYDSY